MLNFTGGKIYWTLIAEHPCASRIFPKNRSSKMEEVRKKRHHLHQPCGVYSTRCFKGSKNLALRRNWGKVLQKSTWVTNKKTKGRAMGSKPTEWVWWTSYWLALFHLSPASERQVIGGEGFLVEIPIFSTGCVLWGWIIKTHPFNILGWFQCSCKTLVELDHFSK